MDADVVRQSCRTFANGFPKSGNHALVKALQLLGVPAQVNHRPFADGLPEGVERHVFVKRDPRDVVVSWLRFNGQPVTEGTFLAAFRRFQAAPLVEEMAAFEGWLTAPDTLVVRFEALVFSPSELRSIAAFLGVPYLEDAFPNLPGYTVTWNDVRSDYRAVWSDAVRAAWHAEGGDELLARWGY